MTTASNETSSKPRAAYLVQRDQRKRVSFGKVWTENVKEGRVSDKEKLVLHAVKLKVGRPSALGKLSMPTLLAKVQKALAH